MSLEAKICSGCGQPILEDSWIDWGGRYYHNDHVPKHPPPMPPAPSADKLMVLRALRLIEERARKNDREGLDAITVGDIEWAIQEIERG